MGVRRLSPDEVAASAIRALGLDETGVDLFSPEALAASLRRAASFLCPATPGRIVQSVVEILDGLPGYSEQTKGHLETMLDSLLAYGDLLELPTDSTDAARRRIFLGPPSYIRRASGSYLLMGVRPDATALIGEELSPFIDYEGHVRTVRSSDSAEELIASSGLTELSAEQWLQAPRAAAAGDVVDEYVRRLQAAGPSGDIEDARIIDPSAPVTYYLGRWRAPKRNDEGQFVARRPQAYGADLWCFAAVSRGNVVRLVDLPVAVSLAPGADEAWRLQAALDALAGHPQRMRVRTGGQANLMVIDVFSPLPSWAQRRLDVVGTPLLRSRGALLSYGVPQEEFEEELRFLEEMLWMSVDEPAEGTNDDD
jgi:hypothetical protein